MQNPYNPYSTKMQSKRVPTNQMHVLKFITSNNLKSKFIMAEQNNQVARELKWLHMKKPDPSSLNVRELRGMRVNEVLHMPSSPICMSGAVQISNINGICLPPPINQSTPASVSSILPQSSSDLDTDQDEFIDEKIKQVA